MNLFSSTHWAAHSLLIFLYAAQLIVLLNTLINFFTLRTLVPMGEIATSEKRNLAVIVPMRNEEANVTRIISHLVRIKSQWIARGDLLEIIVVDDQSEDSTKALLNNFGGDINIVEGKPLPSGWLGKNWANQQGVNHLCDKYSSQNPESLFSHLLFIDADIDFVDDPILSALTLIKERKLDYLSAYPKEIAATWSEKLIQPLLQWSWCSSLPVRFVEESSRTSTVVANGQFFLISFDMYRSLGEHQAISSSVLDDMDLARAVITHGGHGTVVDGSKLISCRMYENFPDLFRGYRKSLWNAFPSIGAVLGATIWLVSTYIAPIIFLCFQPHIALPLVASIFISRFLTAVKTKSSLISPLPLLEHIITKGNSRGDHLSEEQVVFFPENNIFYKTFA